MSSATILLCSFRVNFMVHLIIQICYLSTIRETKLGKNMNATSLSLCHSVDLKTVKRLLTTP